MNQELFKRLVGKLAGYGGWYWTSVAVSVIVTSLAGPWIFYREWSLPFLYKESQFYSELNPWTAEQAASTVVVLIDDEGYYGVEYNHAQSPISPRFLAGILRRLDQVDVRCIVLDFDFSWPDAANHSSIDHEFSRELPELEKAIAEIAGRRPIVLGVALTADGTSAKPMMLEHLLVTVPSGLVSLGIVNLPPDVRYIPVSMKDVATGRVLYSLPVAAMRTIDPGENVAQMERRADNSGGKPPMALFMEPSKMMTLSSSEVLRAEKMPLRTRIGGRVALVGGSWNDRSKKSGIPIDSVVATPVGMQPGVMVHANSIEALISGRVSWTIPYGWIWALEILTLMCVALILAVSESAIAKFLAVATGILGNLIAGYVLSTNVGLAANMILPLLALVGHSFFDVVNDWRILAWKSKGGSE